MKRLIFIAVSLALIVPLLAVADDITIRLAAIAPLTGPVSEYGIASRNGMALYRKESVESCPVELIWDDSRYDGATTVSAYRNLSMQSIDAVYVWGTGPAQALVPLTERENVPTLAVTIEPPASPWQWTIRADNYADQYARLIAGYISKNKIERVAVVKTGLGYFESQYEALKKHTSARLELIQSFNPGDMDFRATITRIQSIRPQMVGVYLMPGQISSFFRQAKEQRFAFLAYGTDDFGSVQEIRAAGSAINGSVFASNLVSPGFTDRYKKEFGNVDQIGYAAKAYDLFAILCKASKGLGKENRGKLLLDRIKSTNLTDGATGTVVVSTGPDGETVLDYPVVLRKIAGETFDVFPEGR